MYSTTGVNSWGKHKRLSILNWIFTSIQDWMRKRLWNEYFGQCKRKWETVSEVRHVMHRGEFGIVYLRTRLLAVTDCQNLSFLRTLCWHFLDLTAGVTTSCYTSLHIGKYPRFLACAMVANLGYFEIDSASVYGICRTNFLYTDICVLAIPLSVASTLWVLSNH